jgi:Domain of unknown function (DUF6285)
MAHDWPSLPEMLTTVREYIDDLTPRLTGMDRYHAMCAVQLLDVVSRELTEWTPRETADDARLRALGELGAEVPHGQLTARLSSQIHAGKFDQRMAELERAMLEHVMAKVRVTKPAYLAPEHREP